jgi:hypothetical protein
MIKKKTGDSTYVFGAVHVTTTSTAAGRRARSARIFLRNANWIHLESRRMLPLSRASTR